MDQCNCCVAACPRSLGVGAGLGNGDGKNSILVVARESGDVRATRQAEGALEAAGALGFPDNMPIGVAMLCDLLTLAADRQHIVLKPNVEAGLIRAR